MNKEKFIGIQNWLRDIQAYLKLDTDTEDVANLDNSTSGIGTLPISLTASIISKTSSKFDENSNIYETESEISEDNVSVVQYRRCNKEYGHLPLLDQFERLESRAIILQDEKIQTIIRSLILEIRKKYPHGLRNTKILNSLKNRDDQILDSTEIQELEYLDLSIDQLVTIITLCTDKFAVGNVMECGDVRMGSKERRSDAIVPDEELWLVPRQPFIFRDDFFDQQIIKSAQNENLNTLQDKIAFIINQYTREIVINLTKYEYRRNIYDVALDMQETTECAYTLCYIQSIFQKKEMMIHNNDLNEYLDQSAEYLSLFGYDSVFSYFKIDKEAIKNHETFTLRLIKHKDVQSLVYVHAPVWRSPHSRMKDTFITMENYYLAGILKLEIDASNHSQKLILEDMVTLEDSMKWQKTQYKLFQNEVENDLLKGMQLGYATSCSQISFKFFDGQNVQLEVELFSELEKFSKEIYDPAVKFSEDSAPLKRVFEPSFSDKYTYYVEGREHLLEFGLLVAVLTSDGDQPIWNRAIIAKTQSLVKYSSYYDRRITKKIEIFNENQYKRGRRRHSSEYIEEAERQFLEDHSINVYFVDYGYSSKAPITNIRFLDKSFLKYPAFALPAYLFDERTAENPREYSDKCNWQKCLGYAKIVQKLNSESKINELVVAILNKSDFHHGKQPIVKLYKRTNLETYKKSDNLSGSDPYRHIWFNNRISRFKDAKGHCIKDS